MLVNKNILLYRKEIFIMVVTNTNGTFKPNIFKVALSSLTEDTQFQLTAVRLNRATDANGKLIDAIKDITYTVYVPDVLAQLNIKVDSTTPVVTPEQLDAAIDAGKDIFVELPTSETYIRPYKIEYGAAFCTIKAPYIKLS